MELVLCLEKKCSLEKQRGDAHFPGLLFTDGRTVMGKVATYQMASSELGTEILSLVSSMPFSALSNGPGLLRWLGVV